MTQKVFILRDRENEKETTGLCIIRDETGKIWNWNTLELPDNNHDRNISRIPEGTYNCAYSYSPHFNKGTYEILNVPDRSNIRIHSANYFNELRGCIAIGKNLYDMNRDGELDLTESRKAIEEFETVLQKKPFKLKIMTI